MGAFNRYRADVARVGEELSRVMGGPLEAQAPGEVHRSINGTWRERRVRVDLNEMHGIHGVACAIREIPLKSFAIHDVESMFASGPKVTERLRVRSMFDGESLWELLPDETRRAIGELLSPPSSSMTLSPGELSALLGPVGLLRDPKAASRILASLDRLLAIAGVLDERWNVDPSTVGGGSGFMGRSTVPPIIFPPPEPRKILPCDAATAAQAVKGAREALLAQHARSIIEPFPALDPLGGDRLRRKGKVVLLPPVPPSRWASEVIYKVLAAGDATHGWYFARTEEAGFARVLAATERYQRATGVSLGDEPYALIARINGDPGLTVIDKKGTFGLEVDTLGAQIGDRLFVDATQVVDGESRFAGEVV